MDATPPPIKGEEQYSRDLGGEAYIPEVRSPNWKGNINRDENMNRKACVLLKRLEEEGIRYRKESRDPSVCKSEPDLTTNELEALVLLPGEKRSWGRPEETGEYRKKKRIEEIKQKLKKEAEEMEVEKILRGDEESFPNPEPTKATRR